MSEYVCSKCGEPAYYDGRAGDTAILMCGHGYPHKPIPKQDYDYPYGR